MLKRLLEFRVLRERVQHKEMLHKVHKCDLCRNAFCCLPLIFFFFE